MSKINNEQVANDIRTAFEAMKTLFNMGSSSINLKTANEGLLSNTPSSGGTGSKSDYVPFCINVCGMPDLVDSIKMMKDSLQKLQMSLVTLEYCLITLTVILGFAIAVSVCVVMWYIAKTTVEGKTKKKSESPSVNFQTIMNHHVDSPDYEVKGTET